MRFLPAIAVSIAALFLVTACGDDHVCPLGSERVEGRCRLSSNADPADYDFSLDAGDAGAFEGTPTPMGGADGAGPGADVVPSDDAEVPMDSDETTDDDATSDDVTSGETDGDATDGEADTTESDDAV